MLSSTLLLLLGSTAVSLARGVRIRDVAGSRFFGAAANTSFLFIDKNYTGVAKTQFSIFTPENELKWENSEPSKGVFNFTGADEIVNFAKSVNASMRGHTFLWGNQLAPWVNASLSATELDKALKNHIATIMKRYKGQNFFGYDVINEMISDTTNATFKDNIWTQKFGEEALPKALRYARAADPTVKLFINDYSIEGINNKSDTLYNVVQGFIRDGVPIDAVGFQSHFFLGGVPDTLQQNLQRFSDLGLDVAITELDINMRAHANATNVIQQAQDYHTVVAACVAVERCVSVTVWGITDNHSWIPTGDVLPWDGQAQPKPAFDAIVNAFGGK